MPLHAALKAALLLVPVLALSQQPVPLIGLADHDQSFVEHECVPTGNVVQGSTHTYNHFHDMWLSSGLVPDLVEVRCPVKPVEILDRSIEWRAFATGRLYYAKLEIKLNVEGIARFDIGGVFGECSRQWQGYPSPGYRNRPAKGDVGEIHCAQLGNKIYDAEAEVAKVIDQAEVCRVVFIDRLGMKGRYHQTWFNHGVPVCDGMRAIDRLHFCRWNNNGQPHAVTPEDICDGVYPRKG